MPAILEPIEAGLIVAIINKYIINNNNLWVWLCGTEAEEAKQPQEDASSTTTSIADTDVRMHHPY